MDQAHLKTMTRSMTLSTILPPPQRYVPRIAKLAKRYRAAKYAVNSIIRHTKERFTTVPRKHPEVSREHTEFHRSPARTTCPNCLNYVVTNVYHYNTVATHVIAASLVPTCLCVLPYAAFECRDTAHYCPACDIYLGTKFGIGRFIFHLLEQIKSMKPDADELFRQLFMIF